MAIKEFVIGPQNYFEENYFSGDYTESNVSRAFLECDIDNIKGGRVVTGEYYEDNYIDGTYFHNNSMGFVMVVEAMVVQEATVSATNYFQDSYFEQGYYKDSGSRFSLTIKLGETVDAQGAFTVQVSQVSVIGKLQLATVTVEALFAPSVTAQATLRPQVFLEEDIDFAVTVSKFTGYESLQEFFASLNAQNDRTREFDSASVSEFSAQVQTARTRDVESSLAVSFDCTADANILGVVEVGMSTASAVSVDVTKLKTADSNIGSIALLTAQPISYLTRPNPYLRPNDLREDYFETGEFTFSTDKVYGERSLQINRPTNNEASIINGPRTQFTFAGQDMVLETWVKVVDHSGTVTSFLTRSTISVQSRFGIDIDNNANPYFRAYYIDNLGRREEFSNFEAQIGVWYHVALRRVNGVFRFEVNGVLRNSKAYAGLLNSQDTVNFLNIRTIQRLKTIRLDGTTFRLGNSTVNGLNSAPVNDYLSTMFLYQYENNVLDNLSQVVDLNENLSTTTALTAVPNATLDGITLHQSLGTLTASITVLSGVKSNMDSVFAVDATVGKLQDASANIDALFTPTVEAVALNPGEVEAVAITALTADATKFKGVVNLNITAQSTLAADAAQRIRTITRTLSAAAALNCNFEALTNYAPRWYGSFNLNFLFQIEPGSSGAQFNDPTLVVINGVSSLHPDYPFANLLPINTNQGAPTRANKTFAITLLDGQGTDELRVSIGVIQPSGTYFERDYQWTVADSLSWRNQPGVWHRLELSVFQNTATLTINGASLGQPNIARTPSAFFDPAVVNVPSTSFIPWHNLVGASFAGSGSAANITDVHFNSASSKAKFAQAFQTTNTALTASVLRVQFGEGALTAVSSLTAAVDNIKGTSADLATTAQATVSAVKTASGLSQLSTTAELNAIIGKLTGYASNQTAEFTQTTDNVRVRFAFSEQDSVATLVADSLNSRIRDNTVAADVQTQLAADFVRTRDVLTELEAIATKLAAVAKVGDFLVTLESASALSVQAQVVTDTRNDVEAVFDLAATATKAVEALADINSEFSLDEVSTRVRFADTAMTTTAELSAVSTRIRFADTDLAVSFDAEITPNRIRPAESGLNTTATLECEFDVIKEAGADLSSEFIGVFSLQKIIRLELDLQVQAFTLTVGDVINIDPRTQLRVVRETRQFRIAQENNTVLVPKETRILVI